MGASDPEVAPWARGGAAGMAGAGAGAGARGGAAAGVEARARDPPPAHRAHPRHPRPAAQPSARRMDGGSGGLGSGDNAPTTEALFVALGAGVTALSHPLLYVKLLIQVGHEPMPPTLGTNVLGRKVLYLPSFFTYAKYIVQVDGKIGLFRGLSPRLMSNALSTVTRGSMKKVFPPDEIEQVSNKDDMKTSLKKVVKETSYEMMMQCVSRMLAHPLHVISMRCMVQFVGREAKYSGVLSSIGKIFKEEGLLGFFVGLIPHLLGDVVFLWGCNLLAHFINAYLVDDSFSQALAIRSYTKFVMGIAVSMLTYPFLLVGDLMAVNNCGLQAGLPPYSPVFKSWIHCWKYLSVQVSKHWTAEAFPVLCYILQLKWFCGCFIACKDKWFHGIQYCEEILGIYKAFKFSSYIISERI
ncbi:mitochondrial carrier homolog 1 isoform 4 [Homo sapiens]|uniref:Mitochondrial carrier homolog 1 n=3 Tax=cellular organisms TaxID=131567 RepID=H0Y8C3_HUMAN|nr:mitochondrial carrier homolog 1 isoform 4 [Homo sapiens]EAX03925.1 mitochondrial carrier homolog 1 (C. elegans), isoform CRA_a [Homo sapiens]|eukprot:XP_005249036.1 mitochondrial carrier homolog 1 isoform X2 [Homo sapiens]